MANYLKMDKVQTILGLLKLKWSYRQIQRVTGIDRETIAKYDPARAKPAKVPTGGEIPFSQNPPNCPPAPPPFNEGLKAEGTPSRSVVTSSMARSSRSHAAPFHDLIVTKLAAHLDAQRIFQDLKSEHGYPGSYDSVKRYVRHLRGVAPQVFARLESAPGEKAQIDFGQGALTLKDGRYRRPWLFKMTLSFSRHSYEEVVWRQDVQTFLRCHENAFADFGGAPRILKIDNLKSGILDANLFEPIVHPLYAAFAQHYGCVVLPCKVGRPEHKGKVEAGVKYTQNNALKARRFESLEAQNAFLRHWNLTWARQRIHGTTKKQVWQLFHDAERPHLLPLPAEAFQFFEVAELAEAAALGERKALVTRFIKTNLLILDEFGMRQLSKNAAEDLLEIFHRRYHRGATIVASNRPLEDWGKILGDNVAASAILDRFLEAVTIVKITGKSYRLHSKNVVDNEALNA